MLRHRLPREEGAVEHGDAPAGALSVVIPRLPFGSNLDEFHMLSHAASVRWATDASSFDRADIVLLPGSKHVIADLAWMRQRGIDVAVARAAAVRKPVIGVCGGAMMLGMSLDDPNGAEGFARGSAEMLGLLPIRTKMGDNKLTVRSSVDWQGEQHDGYEIRYGKVSGGDDLVIARSELGPVGWRRDNVVATTVHGLFEDPAFVERLLGIRISPVLDDTFAQLADAVEEHLDTDLLRHLTSSGPAFQLGSDPN
jgi:adenosylcobyric acid synthase